MRQVAIIGLSKSTHDDAPWFEQSWERWGLPWDEGYYAALDRAFEMHDLSLIRSKASRRPYDYEQRLRELECPLFMQDHYEEIQNSLRYPYEDVSKVTGYYFNSSIGYMLAMAIQERVGRIGIWGVDMASDDEYGYQRPNAEYMIGLAKGLGIDVYIPEKCGLTKFQGNGIKFGNDYPVYKTRYGEI